MLVPKFPLYSPCFQFDYVGKLCSSGSSRLGMKHSDAWEVWSSAARIQTGKNLTEKRGKYSPLIAEVPLSKAFYQQDEDFQL